MTKIGFLRISILLHCCINGTLEISKGIFINIELVIFRYEKKIKDTTNFISTTNPKDKEWITNIYSGRRDGTGNHAHLTLSGANLMVWYYRDGDGNEIVKDGNV